MASIEELIRESRRRRETAATLAAPGKPLRFRDDRYGLRFLAGVDTNPDGMGFRVTTFDAAGPIGHVEHLTLEAAVMDVLMRGAVLEGRAT